MVAGWLVRVAVVRSWRQRGGDDDMMKDIRWWCRSYGGGGSEVRLWWWFWRRWRRVVASCVVVDLIDREKGSIFGVHRKSSPGKFFGGGGQRHVATRGVVDRVDRSGGVSWSFAGNLAGGDGRRRWPEVGQWRQEGGAEKV
nr:hypothetical protein [Tanacetum cinerariifolium]